MGYILKKEKKYTFSDYFELSYSTKDILEELGYAYRFEFGTGGHTLRHGGALFADALRWLWRD